MLQRASVVLVLTACKGTFGIFVWVPRADVVGFVSVGLVPAYPLPLLFSSLSRRDYLS